MPSIVRVESSIRKLEGFDVHFTREQDGKDVRGDKKNLPSYTYDRAAPGRFSVTQWRDGRFRKSYPSYSVEILDGTGKPVHGRTKLTNLRATYD